MAMLPSGRPQLPYRPESLCREYAGRNLVSPGMLSLQDSNSTLPLYQQLKVQIQSHIQSAEWGVGTRLPSENELVDQLGVSRMTIHRALRELTQEGFLERVHGLGTFVAKPRRHASLITLRDIADEIRTTGSRHHCRVLKLDHIQASQRLAERMEVDIGTVLFRLKAVHYQDDIAIQLEQRLVNPAMAPAFTEQDFTNRTATDYLIGLHRPEQMEHEVRAVLPGLRTARLLMIEASEPCLALYRRTWRNGQVVTDATMTYPGSRYALSERYLTADYQKNPNAELT